MSFTIYIGKDKNLSCGCNVPGKHLLHSNKDPLILCFKGTHWSAVCLIAHLEIIAKTNNESYKTLLQTHKASQNALETIKEDTQSLKKIGVQREKNISDLLEEEWRLTEQILDFNSIVLGIARTMVLIHPYLCHLEECNLTDYKNSGRIPTDRKHEMALCDCDMMHIHEDLVSQINAANNILPSSIKNNINQNGEFV